MKQMRVADRFPALVSNLSLLILLVMHQPSHAAEPSLALNRERASAFARLALKGLSKEYPNKPEHVLAGPADVKGPKALHPAFYGSYDWHSSVHGHWMLVRLLRTVPRPAGGGRDPGRAGGALDGREPQGRGRLLRPQGEQAVRAAVRLGLAPQAGRGAPRLGRPGREVVGEEPPAARGRGRRPVSGILPEADLPDPDRRAPEHGVRALVRPRLRPVGRRHATDWAGRGAGPGLLRRGRRRPGRLGAGRGGLLLAEPDRRPT